MAESNGNAPALRLWEVLRAELEHLRPQSPAFKEPAGDPAAGASGGPPPGSDAAELAAVYRVTHRLAKMPQNEKPGAADATSRGGAAEQAASPPPRPAPAGPLTALCFSGGGIRSATFNLGVLQGMARLGLLGQFDYLSSVSGGGYINSWLARWVREQGIDKVTDQLTRTPDDPMKPEPEPLNHLRQYSNYLSPRLGVLSADTWTMVAIVLRNLLLNWAVLLPLLTAPLLVPLLAVATWPVAQEPRSLLVYAAALELTGLFFMSALRDSGGRGKGPSGRWTHNYLKLGLLPRLAAVPLLLAVVQAYAEDLPDVPKLLLYQYCAAWAVGLPLLALLLSAPFLRRGFWAFAWDFLSVLAAGCVDMVIYKLVLKGMLRPMWESDLPLFVIFGPGVILGTMLLGRTVLVAISSISEHWLPIDGDADREWFSRWSAWTLIVLVVWMAISSLVLFAPSLLTSAAAKLGALISAGGLGTWVAMLGKAGSTPANKEKGEPSLVSKVIFAVAAPLFVVALVLCLSWGGQALLGFIWPDGVAAAAALQEPGGTGWIYVPPYTGTPLHLLIAIAGLVVAGAAISYPVNVNRFSMQAGYRNRLIRAYPGASNPDRRPNPFTGFDPEDNVRMTSLLANRPFPFINMTLNLVSGEELAWQQRKAESFTATPLHCGSARLGYRPSGEYGGRDGLTLGTAVATSGAAANPNMGLYTTSPAITFIMALFNVRLGIWLGNPRNVGRLPTYQRTGPRFSARVFVAEAFGLTNDKHPYVSLSDGGHFEDLGIYEMVRRRCHTIIVSDAGADPSYAFDDLGNAIRKIRIDFGVPIVFKSRVRIYPKQQSGQPAEDGRYCAVAKILYSAVDRGGVDGTLIYIKPSICDGSPFDVENYARESKPFPHESTADQWFSESQFESYRALGDDAVQAMAGRRLDDPPADFDDFIARVNAYVEEQKASGAAVTMPASGPPPPAAAPAAAVPAAARPPAATPPPATA